jgi:iron(III) transport system substrate-binding protein
LNDFRILSIRIFVLKRKKPDFLLLNFKVNVNMSNPRSIFLSFLLIGFLSACSSPDLENNTPKKIVVYTDHLGSNDSLIFNDFYKNTKIKVYVRVHSSEEILKIISEEKYDSYADLIILHGANKLISAANQNLFRSFTDDETKSNITKNYLSAHKKWIALSKTPLVIAYDKRILKEDTLSNYSDLLFPSWKNKIALQGHGNSTLAVLESSLSQMEAKILHDFKTKLTRQSTLKREGDDLTQIKRIQSGQAALAVVELSSMEKRWLEKDTLAKQLKNQVGVIFPSQTKKGSFYNITGAGIYRYARNPGNAQKLLEYLTLKGPQYFFAAGRWEFPVNESVKANIRLEEYGKFRARFYAPKVR